MRMKRSVKLSIDAALLLRARRLEEKRVRWLRENVKAIAAHNERVARKGTFSDGLRRF